MASTTEKKFVILGELTDLNSYIKAINRNRFLGNTIKQKETGRVCAEILDQKIKPVNEYPVRIEYKWYSKNSRIDVDNVAFAKKFINDGMVMAGLLQNDSRKHVAGFNDEFYIDKDNPRIEVKIKPSSTMH